MFETQIAAKVAQLECRAFQTPRQLVVDLLGGDETRAPAAHLQQKTVQCIDDEKLR